MTNSNSNCEKTQKFKLQQNSKTQIVTKLKNSNCEKKLKNSNCDKIKIKKKINFDKTQKLKLWQNTKTQIVTKLKTWILAKLKNSMCDKTQKLKLWQN